MIEMIEAKNSLSGFLMQNPSSVRDVIRGFWLESSLATYLFQPEETTGRQRITNEVKSAMNVSYIGFTHTTAIDLLIVAAATA